MIGQSNTSIYIAGACIAAIIGIVVSVRAMAPEEAWSAQTRTTKPVTADIKLNTQTRGGDTDNIDDIVDTLPIMVDGKRGVLIRYEAPTIDEQVQQGIAEKLVREVRNEVTKAGLKAIVIEAVAPPKQPGSTPEKHRLMFEYKDGAWIQTDNLDSVTVIDVDPMDLMLQQNNDELQADPGKRTIDIGF
ncbi:MAG: hypothetical protein FWD57_05535 [Polyangiaceae bacterium]|nr:hypothetical protein [Polyangiaceae bacterium]